MVAPFTRFIGRDSQLAQLARLFDAGARVVTLIGPPGIGKTRLAKQFVSDSPGVFVDLVGRSTVDEISDAVAEASEEFAEGDAFVTLDNAEHLVVPITANLSKWTERWPNVRFLLTSRERMGLDIERVLRVPPLHVPASTEPNAEAIRSSDSIQLFLAVAQEDYSVADIAVLGRVVAQLDGVPLAILLAAARSRVLSPQQLLMRLREHLDMLGPGRREADPRHATLRQAIDWSWSLLSAAERLALATCSVFAGGFTLDAAEAVLADTAAVDLLQGLVDKSLIHSDRPDGSEVRFRTYRSVREYALEKLSERPECTRVLRRHALFYGRFADSLVTGGQERSIGRHIGLELDNIVNALERMCDDPTTSAPVINGAMHRTLALVHVVAGHFRLGGFHAVEHAATQVVAAVATAQDGGAHGNVRAAMQRFIAALFALFRRYDDAATYSASARESASDDAGALSQVVYGEAIAHLASGEFLRAKRCLDQASELASKCEDEQLQVLIRAQRGELHRLKDRMVEALGDFQSAAAMAGSLGDSGKRARLLVSAAIAARDSGDSKRARTLLESSLQICELCEDSLGAVAVHLQMGALAHLAGELDQAEQSYRRALEMGGAGDARHLAGHVLCQLGSLHVAQENLSAASIAFDDAASICGAMGDPNLIATLALHRETLSVGISRTAAASGDTETVRSLRTHAQRMLDDPTPGKEDIERLAPRWGLLQDSEELRFARHVLRRELEKGAHVFARDGGWFFLADGTRVDLSTRPQLKRILAVLVGNYDSAPSESVPIDNVIAGGWPGENVAQESAINRVHVALSKLRGVGLRKLIVRDEAGYRLDANQLLLVRDD